MKFRLSLAAAVAVTALGVTAAQAADDEITIAMAGPLTGGNATFGDQMKRGAEQAVADINAAGGVLGKKLVLVTGDDACDPKQAVAVANELKAKGAKFVAGHFCSGSSIPASAVYHEEGMLQISPASTNPKLTEQGFKNVFRVCGRDDQQGGVAGALLATHFKGKNIAIINDKSAYGKGLADETQKALEAHGGKAKLIESYTAGEKDYSALVSKLKEANIEVLYVGGYQTEAGLLARQMHDQGMHTRIVSGDALVTNEYWAITGDIGEGTLMTFGPDPRRMVTAKAAVDEFHKAGYEPEGYTLYSYASVQIYVDAVKKAKTTELKKVEEVLHHNTFDTVIGKLSFDAKGDIKSPGYVWYEWKGGKYGQVDTVD